MAMIDWEDRSDPARTMPYAKVARFSMKRDWAEALLALAALCFAAREWTTWMRTVMSWF